MTGDISATQALNRFRATFYLVLARTFSREVDEDALEGLDKVSTALIEAADLLSGSPHPDFLSGGKLLRLFFDGIRGNQDPSVLQDLARSFASLFLGVGPKTVSPCESTYKGESPLLYQSAHFEVQQAYGEIGMAKNETFPEPDDHIAVELSYMARLCELALEGAETDPMRSVHRLEMQRAFLEGHLLAWVPAFSRDLFEAAPSPFYRAIAHLLNGYIHWDFGLIESLMKEYESRES